MAEPRIHYTTAGDGVRIAYCVQGEGLPLVAMTGWPFTHLTAELTVPSFRFFHEYLAERCRYIRYDGRGSGLSERHPEDISAQARALDLSAVVDHLGLDEFSAWAWGASGIAAVFYAASHPERLRRLVLWDSLPQQETPRGVPRLEVILELMSKDWELFTETVASVMFGWSTAADVRLFARYLREAVTQEMAVRALEETFKSDARRYIPRITAPTLVLQARDALGVDMDLTAELTSLLPDASLTMLDGTWITTNELAQRVADAILGFIGAEDAPGAAATPPGGLVTILFTDLSSSTALTQRLGDAKAQELVRAHNAIVREALAAAAGTEIKHTGDGIMASFPTASGALECAVAIQRAVAERAEPNLQVHIGLNAGEPVAEEQDLFGTAVQLARRICDQGEGGEILASDVVRQLAAGKGFLFADRGDVVPKGFDEAVRLYEVRWRAEGPP